MLGLLELQLCITWGLFRACFQPVCNPRLAMLYTYKHMHARLVGLAALSGGGW